jgi:hypothetical protein
MTRPLVMGAIWVKPMRRAPGRPATMGASEPKRKPPWHRRRSPSFSLASSSRFRSYRNHRARRPQLIRLAVVSDHCAGTCRWAACTQTAADTHAHTYTQDLSNGSVDSLAGWLDADDDQKNWSYCERSFLCKNSHSDRSGLADWISARRGHPNISLSLISLSLDVWCRAEAPSRAVAVTARRHVSSS